MSQPFGFETFFEISKFCSSVFLIFEFGKETCSKVFCALIYFVWFPTIPFASWGRGDQSDVLYTISSRSFSLMYSARVLVLPPRHDNLWRSVNIDIQLAGLWHEREPCLHFNSLWSDYALTLGQLSTVPKKDFVFDLIITDLLHFFPILAFKEVIDIALRRARVEMTWRRTQMMRLMTSWTGWSPSDPIFGPTIPDQIFFDRNLQTNLDCSNEKVETNFANKCFISESHTYKSFDFIWPVYPSQPNPHWPGQQSVEAKSQFFSPTLPLQRTLST